MSYHVILREFSCRVHGVHSLKEKRSLVQSFKMRVRNRWNLSIAEVDYQDQWQMTTLAIVGIGNNKQKVEQELDRAAHLLEQVAQLEIISDEITLL
ncbi:hypothetical protein SAMN05444392_11533 [Seinonella peptonophila]|uniref:DUF503 domain-containing protein n=1 Tax=Seinonella peptonophila TaxID=112248 RepID=A0A1M5APR9_9BACL|nr:DUF503 domain-containing protein [Seinonella peptonophila]SHF32243.1 hypothetical protein SAMN05444392_11533 [Seinonella peptonophila]